MPLSTKLDDQNSQPLGEGFITLSTSAGNALVFRSPAEANIYRLGNAAQFQANPTGGYNDEYQAPAQA